MFFRIFVDIFIGDCESHVLLCVELENEESCIWPEEFSLLEQECLKRDKFFNGQGDGIKYWHFGAYYMYCKSFT